VFKVDTSNLLGDHGACLLLVNAVQDWRWVSYGWTEPLLVTVIRTEWLLK